MIIHLEEEDTNENISLGKERNNKINPLKKEKIEEVLEHKPPMNKHHDSKEDDNTLLIPFRNPFISMSLLNSISNLCGWPFESFGNLVQNAKDN